MKKIAVWSYDNGSEGLALLKEKLVAKGFPVTLLGHNRTNFNFVEGFKKIAINWGFQRDLPIGVSKVLNDPGCIINASNKLKCFQKLAAASVSIPKITVNKGEAKDWASDGGKVYCRTTANGAYGDGIVVATSSNQVVDAELYTKGITCKREYRSYMFNGKMIDLVAAVKLNTLPPDVTEYNDNIRNWKGGYGWARNQVTIPDGIKTKLAAISKKAMEAVGLDFGAIDIVRDNEDNLYVLEVNTAPGWENYTAEKFADAIAAFYESFAAAEPAPRAAVAPRVARTVTAPNLGDLDEEERQLILDRRRGITLNTLKEIYLNGETGTYLRNNNITEREWVDVYRQLRG